MIFLALRYLLSKRKQTFLTLLGIFFGTVAFVAISGFMLGFREYIIDQLVNNDAHVRIQAREEFLSAHSLDQSFAFPNQHIFWIHPPSGRKDSAIIENPQQWYARLKNDARVKAFSPQLRAAVVFAIGKTNVSSTIIGCDPVAQLKVTTIADYIVEGRFEDLATGGNRVVIGEELRKRLGVKLYQNVMLSLGNAPAVPFKVVAVYRFGNNESDALAYGTLADVQKINSTPSKVNEIAVKLEDYNLAAQLAATWSLLGSEKVKSWDQLNASVFNIFRIQDLVRFLSTGSIILVAGFGIFNVLNMTVMQKRKDVAILRSMGYGEREIVTLFFVQGCIVGVIGTVIGLMVGYGLCRYIATLPAIEGPIGNPGGKMYVSFSQAIYIQATLLSISSALISSIYPALTAGRLTPIEIIRAGAE